MRVLVVGSGAREHALAWKLAQSSALTELHAAPGNPGIAHVAECHPVLADDAEGILALVSSIAADLVVVGPEAPLVAGLADLLRRFGVPVFGPSAKAAAIEGSKSLAKEVMAAAGVPTAELLEEARAPCVLKADGLAGGKGVHVCRTQSEVEVALESLQVLGRDLVVEELLEGVEVSLFALCDGRTALPLVPAQDFKRAFDGDEGPNTGGMGSYAPLPWLGREEAERLASSIHVPVLAELERRDALFVGLLYAGLMLTDDGPRVLEFNCRFGDPETQSVVPLLDGDFLEALAAAAVGDLGGVHVEAVPGAAVTVVLAARDYPAAADRGTPISGISDCEATGALVFHAGTAVQGERLVTNGGRVLGVTGLGATVADARAAAYDGAARIECRALRSRSDIALAAASTTSYGGAEGA